MIIRNGCVLRGRDRKFVRGDLFIRDGKIAGVPAEHEMPGIKTDQEVIDASGLLVLPGLIDTHIHGSVGVEFAAKKEDFEKARVWLAGQGVTAIAPTVRAMMPEEMAAAQENIAAEARKPSRGARICGIHLEGPFVSKEKNGSMTPPDITCDVDSFQRLAAAGSELPKLMTMAPERENALEVIAKAPSSGVAISMGHTNATYEQSMAAIDAGARRATHVFNAMRPFYHRETGILGAVLTDDRVTCEMICDLVHLDEPAMRLVYRMKGADRITVVSDSGAMSGLGDGEYIVGGHRRIVKDGVCRNEQGRLAGSCFCVRDGAANLVRMGIPIEDVSVMCSLNPARALGIADRTGSIEEGKTADLILCDENLTIHAVLIDGRIVA